MNQLKTIWETKDGTKIRIKDMSDRHLINVIRLLHRWAKYTIDNNLSVATSLWSTCNGEIAEYYLEQDIHFYMEAEPDDLLWESVPCYPKLYEEAEKRWLLDFCFSTRKENYETASRQ